MQSLQEWQDRVRAQREKDARDFDCWLKHGSPNLADAWVSVCPHAQSHDVESYRLTDVIERIRTGDEIPIQSKYGEKWVSIKNNQAKVRSLYRAGLAEAKMINDLRISRLLEEMKIDAKPEEVEPVAVRPKENEKVFYLTGLRVRGELYQVPHDAVLFHRPQDLGKARADNAKKWTPAVTLAGLFLPYRDRRYLVRATTLFPIDIDGFTDAQALTDKRAEIAEDEHVLLLFTSISGSGLRACVLGPETHSAAEYERAYRKIGRAKANEWKIETQIDDHTCDVSRLCFLPYDDQIHFAP